MIKLTELAQVSGISKWTINRYLRMGLLHPPQKRGFNQSVFDWTHLNRIRRIRELRENHRFNLSKIKETLLQEDIHSPKGLSEKEVESLIQALKNKKKETRDKKNKIKRNEIVDAAIALFTKNGYEKTTLEAIAESLNIAKSTIYLYFENKEELFMDCIERLTLIAVPEEAWDEIKKEEDPELRMRKRGEAFHKSFPSFKGILTLTRSVLGGSNRKLSEKAKKTLVLMTRPLAKDLRQGIAKGVYRDIDEDLLSHLILGMGEALGCRRMIDSRYTIESGLDMVFDLLKRGIGRQDDQPLSSAVLVDIKGMTTRVDNIRFGGSRFLPTKSGCTTVQIDPQRVSEIKFTSQRNLSQAEISTKEGETLTVEIDGSIVFEGDISIGKLTTRMKGIQSLSFQD